MTSPLLNNSKERSAAGLTTCFVVSGTKMDTTGSLEELMMSSMSGTVVCLELFLVCPDSRILDDLLIPNDKGRWLPSSYSHSSEVLSFTRELPFQE